VDALVQLIDWTINDPDGPGTGSPARVIGLAVDGVTSVEVTLEDGRATSAAPVDNFYEVSLPNDALPWDVATVVARLANGTAFTQTVSISAPA
jgi:hypothetical protein